MMSQAILVLLADLVNHLYQDCLVIQSLLFLVLPFRPSHLESLETPQGPFHLSPGLETLELLEGLANHCPLHLLEDQVFLGFQGHLGHLK